MADLRITGVSNNQLELTAADGTRHYLAISDDLLKALKSREVSLPQNLSPREIQEAIRTGSTIEQIVSETGADQDLVERFARPIISELRHVVELARNIRLSLAGDRFAEPTLVEFGSVMDERLVNNGAQNISWSAKKNIEGEWLVSVAFDTPEGSGIATWSFDPKKLFLAPENESALQLSNGVPVSVTKTVPIAAQQKVEEPEPHSHPAVMLSVVPETEEVVEDASDLFEIPRNTTPLRIVEEEVAIETSIDNVVAETAAVVQEEPETREELTEVVEVVIEQVSEPVTEATETNSETFEEKAEESTNKPQVNSRWAEVLFGSKEDEEEN